MFCPKCGYEYNQEISECPDCQVKLVLQLDKEPEKFELEYKDWVQLARLNSQPEADMFIETLRDKKIPAVLISGTGHFGQTGQIGISSFRPIGGGLSICVPESFVVDADIEGKIIFGDEWSQLKLVDIK